MNRNKTFSCDNSVSLFELTEKNLHIAVDRDIVFSLLDKGWSVSKILVEGVPERSKSWVYATAKKWRDNHKSLLENPRSVRPKKLNQNQKRTIERNLTKKCHAKKIPANLKSSSTDISKTMPVGFQVRMYG